MFDSTFTNRSGDSMRTVSVPSAFCAWPPGKSVQLPVIVWPETLPVKTWM